MIQVRHVDLSADARKVLEAFQKAVDQHPTHSARVTAAVGQWESKRGNAVFQVVRETLDAMSRRCMYCEDNSGYQVEHFRPKSIYPELVFAWENYLYACGVCNGPKGNRFAIFPSPASDPVHLVASNSAPQAGDPVLLDPRHDDPFAYMKLDLRDPFFFRPLHTPPSPGFHRADYTIGLLGLNERDDLVEARSGSYEDFRARLREYVEDKRAGADEIALKRRERSILRKNHITVWREMQRQHKVVAELRPLFDEAPEALGW
jgi:uncharacterized protein (TIGR02646 family)